MPNQLDQKAWPFINALLKAHPDAEVYLVGGSVRDALLDRPSKDDDFIARNLPLDQLQTFLADHGTVNLVGKRFGILKFRQEGSDAEYDIALPRKESSRSLSGAYRDFDVYTDPELPLEEDLARRDFTINAMAYDLREKRLVDPFAGQKDLEAKIIRTVGSTVLRFQEDYSRMLRAIRFACQLNFDISDSVKTAVQKLAPHLNDKTDEDEWIVAREVLSQEFLKALDADPPRCLRLLDELNVLDVILPELKALQDCEQSAPYHLEGAAWDHVLLALEKTRTEEYKQEFPESIPVLSKLGILFHDIAKPQTLSKDDDGTIHFYGHEKKGEKLTREICNRLKLGSTPYAPFDCSDLAWITRHHLFAIFDRDHPAPFTKLEELFFSENKSSESLLHTILADLMASVSEPEVDQMEPYRLLKNRLEQMAPNGKLPAPLLDGNDVIKLLNIKPGPKVKEALLDVREKQFRGDITSTEEAKSYLRQQA